jgi:hypothetical protein
LKILKVKLSKLIEIIINYILDFFLDNKLKLAEKLVTEVIERKALLLEEGMELSEGQ